MPLEEITALRQLAAGHWQGNRGGRKSTSSELRACRQVSDESARALVALSACTLLRLLVRALTYMYV